MGHNNNGSQCVIKLYTYGYDLLTVAVFLRRSSPCKFWYHIVTDFMPLKSELFTFKNSQKNSSKSAAGLSTRKMSKIAMFLFFPQSFPKQFLFWQTEPWSGLVTIGEKIKLQKQSFVPHYLSFVGIWPGCKWSITSLIKVTEVKIFTKIYSPEFDFCAINSEFRC